MANSKFIITITSNFLDLVEIGSEVIPSGNESKEFNLTFSFIPADYTECLIGVDIEETIDNLKLAIDNYYIGAGEPATSYMVTKTATDTLEVELVDPYLNLAFTTTDSSVIDAVVDNSLNVKYEIQYNDTVNIVHDFKLYDAEYYEAPIPVQGYVTMDYGQVGENLEAFRGQGLRVNLEANQSLTFEDLNSDQERTFFVEYFRDSVSLFKGWLNPEGFYEDFVNDNWIVSFDCIDGLGYLKDLSFVDENGLNITGVKTQLEILSLALQRTGIQSNINVGIEIFYTGLSTSLSILENVKANTRRYIKDDTGTSTVMSCEEVIRDVLEPYGAVLTSYNGEWVIYKPNQLYLDTVAEFFKYDYLGVELPNNPAIYYFSFTLGSNINGFYPHHVNENQSITNKPSFGASRISYKYGLLASLIENQDLYTADGTTYDDFTIYDDSRITVPASGNNGITFDVIDPPDIIIPDDFVTFFSNGLSVSQENEYSASYTAVYDTFNDFSISCRTGLSIGVYATSFDPSNREAYWLKIDGTWEFGDYLTIGGLLGSGDRLFNGVSVITSINITNPPIDGELFVAMDTPRPWTTAVYQAGSELRVANIRLSASQGGSNLEGEIFTFQREDNPSSRIDKTKEVFTGDSQLDIYEGTLYKADGTTPTETWFRKGVTEAVPILEMMGSENMRMNAKTIKIFSGDVYGYFPYLSVMNLDGRSGQYGVTKYSYDTKNNTISAEFRQLFGDELTDLEVEKTLDYGTVVEPTIKN